MTRRLSWPGVAIGVVLLFAACGQGDAGSGGDHSQMHHGDGSMMDFGAPADPDDADRTIEIEALDAPKFDPDSLEVEAGDVVTFVVTNAGKNDHEFVLGDEEFQAAHEKAMEAGEMSHGGGMAIEIESGDTEEITWQFSASGEVLYGCHEPGHYEGGMVGTIEIS